jgi:hypothetical protein
MAFNVSGLLRLWTTPLPPTGRVIDLRVIDILTVTDGRINAVWISRG